MVKTFVQSIRGSFTGMAIVCLFVFALTLAACGGDTTATSPSSATTNNTGASSSDTAKSALTVSIKEPSKNQYALEPATFSVKKGDTITLQNQTDVDQDFDSGDASKANVDVIVAGNRSEPVTFNTVGTFVIKSKAGASFTVTVN